MSVSVIGLDTFGFDSSFSNLDTKGLIGSIASPPLGAVLGSISGNLFCDTDLSNTLTTGDDGIGGAAVLDSQNNLVATTTTNPDGSYTFGDIDTRQRIPFNWPASPTQTMSCA